jgi:Tfp pilus assembly pilus retraction ATPase PilT
MGPARPGTHPISEILLAAGVVTEQHIAAALAHQGQTGQRIGEALVELGSATENDIGWALARQFGYTFLDLSPEALDAELVASFPEGLLRRLLVVPLVRTESSLSAGFGDPTDLLAVAELERVAGLRIEPYVVAPSKLLQALDRLEGARHDGHRRTPSSPLVAHRGSVSRERSGEPLLAGHLRRALNLSASEIHFVPVGEEMRVFHRVGSRLVGAGSGPANVIELLHARLEVLGGPARGELKHARGRVTCPLDGEQVQLDVSLASTEAGLAITLGLETSGVRSLEQLGLDPVDLAGLRGVLEQPFGLAFVTGPSRAGRTTTLASLLAAVASESRRSVAFEGGGAALPSPCRFAWSPDQVRGHWREVVVGQGADVVAVDDVFTGEHASGALVAEASGRLVLASSDWCDAFALIDFLASRPAGSQILGERLRFVLHQRMASFEPAAGDAYGAAHRRPVFEVLFVSDAMRAALRDGAPISRLRELATQDQHRTLAERLHGLVTAGRLSPVEAARVAA